MAEPVIGNEGRTGLVLDDMFLAGAGLNQIMGALESKLLPAAERFKPQLVIISAGFDARVDDPLGRLLLEDDDFAEMTQTVMAIADATAGGRIVSVLAGGYNPEGLASAASAHINALLKSE